MGLGANSIQEMFIGIHLSGLRTCWLEDFSNKHEISIDLEGELLRLFLVRRLLFGVKQQEEQGTFKVTERRRIQFLRIWP